MPSSELLTSLIAHRQVERQFRREPKRHRHKPMATIRNRWHRDFLAPVMRRRAGRQFHIGQICPTVRGALRSVPRLRDGRQQPPRAGILRVGGRNLFQQFARLGELPVLRVRRQQ